VDPAVYNQTVVRQLLNARPGIEERPPNRSSMNCAFLQDYGLPLGRRRPPVRKVATAGDTGLGRWFLPADDELNVNSCNWMHRPIAEYAPKRMVREHGQRRTKNVWILIAKMFVIYRFNFVQVKRRDRQPTCAQGLGNNTREMYIAMAYFTMWGGGWQTGVAWLRADENWRRFLTRTKQFKYKYAYNNNIVYSRQNYNSQNTNKTH